jgi:hypothetical protein
MPTSDIAGRIGAVIEQGRAEFADFDERSKAVMLLGGQDQPAFLPAIAGLPHAHRVVARLAEDPEQAERVLALPPRAMAAELARIAVKAGKEPAKAAPTPPADKPARDPSKQSPREYIEARNAEIRARRQPPPEPVKKVNLYDPSLTPREFIAARNAEERGRRRRR